MTRENTLETFTGTNISIHDVNCAFLSRELEIPFAVAINRNDSGDDRVKQYCDEENIGVVLEIPDDRRIAEAYSVGSMIVDVLPEYQKEFLGLYESVSKRKADQRV